MRAEYDRLLATRPKARFRVFVVTTAAPAAASVVGSGGGVVRRGGRSPAAGLPPLAPKMRRVQRAGAGAPPRRVPCAGAARPERAGVCWAPPRAAILPPPSTPAVLLLLPAGACDVRGALHVQESSWCSIDARGGGDRAGGVHRWREGESEEQGRPGGHGGPKSDLGVRVKHRDVLSLFGLVIVLTSSIHRCRK